MNRLLPRPMRYLSVTKNAYCEHEGQRQSLQWRRTDTVDRFGPATRYRKATTLDLKPRIEELPLFETFRKSL